MTNVSESIEFTSNQDINVPSLGELQTDKLTRNLSWDSGNANLISAQLAVTAQQDYDSGAELHVMFNGTEVGVFNWGAIDTSEKSKTFDVTSLLALGVNTLENRYKVLLPAVGGADCYYSASLLVSFDVAQGGSSSPISAGNLQNGNFWSNLGKSILTNIKWVVVGIVGITILVVLLKGVSSGSGVGDLVSMVAKRAKSVFRR